MGKRQHEEASSFGPLLADSKITIEERRVVRCREREILQELREKSAEASQLSSSIFQTKAQELDSIYTKVVYPREANLDACNLDEFSNLVVKQAGLMSASDLTKFDTGQFINSCKAKCAREDTESVFDWLRMGSAVGPCFQNTISVNFMYGSMDTQLVTKERRAPRRRRVDNTDVEESQPTQVTRDSLVQEDAQAGRLKQLFTLIQDHGSCGLFDLCLNPTSFAQTIENMFDMSFLIRDNKAKIEIDKQGLPRIVNKAGVSDVPKPTQSIISLTYEQWEKLAPLYGKPLVGDRPPPRA